ncbi:MAG: DUF4249 domain-containing protein [Crocinitomicaceae bacterium]|nr:DUF4249 domain-containing protein [Crocinitomicaceae bacterium]
MKKIVYLFAITSTLFSCQKVIDVDLNESNPTPVLEGVYSAEDSTVHVQLSLTSSYFNSDPSQSIDAASVNIIDGNGTSTSVPSIGNGMYVLENYVPNYNSTYTLSVVYDGTTFQAESDLRDSVSMEDITYEYFPGFFGSDPGYLYSINYNDPVGLGDYYAIAITINSSEFDAMSELITQDDQLTDGNLVSRPLFTDKLALIGDTIQLELRSIDEDIYDYINELQSIAGGNASAAPANPTSNWNNNALGYFAAYSNTRKSVIIE